MTRGMLSSPMASPSSLRFLGILKQPDSDHLELDESDLFWSSSPDSSHGESPSHPSHLNRPRNHFKRSVSGLSSALNEDHHLVRRKSTLNPSVSAASAARIVPQVNSPKSNFNAVAKFHQSAPVNVPVRPKHNNGGFNALERFDETEDEDEMVPPHVIVARAHVTLSVFEGVGRTLKGRDLRRVRNAVFQQTGFLD